MLCSAIATLFSGACCVRPTWTHGKGTDFSYPLGRVPTHPLRGLGAVACSKYHGKVGSCKYHGALHQRILCNNWLDFLVLDAIGC